MFLFTYAAALIATIFAVGAAAFFFRVRRETLSWTLACYLLSGAIWIGANAVADVSYTPNILILASQIAFVAGILNLLSLIVFVDVLVDGNMPSRTQMGIYSGVTIGFSLLGISPYAINDIAFPIDQPAEILPGPAYSYALFLFIFVFIYGLIHLYLGLTKEHEYRRKMQILYVLIGLLATLSGQILFDVILPLLGEVRFFSLGPITSLFFAAGCAYAITRHKLFDIRIVIQRGAIYSILLAAIVLFYLSLVETFGIFLGSEGNIDILLSAGGTAVAGIFGTPIIERYFRRITDRIFFKDRYHYADALHELSEIVQSHIALTDIVLHAEIALQSILRATTVCISISGEPPEEHVIAHVLPIHLEGKKIATLFLGPKRSGDPYIKEDMQLLNTFAYQAATALGRARLYQEVQELANDLSKKVDERTEELRAAQESQRHMLMDISHNLQTPLAVFQTKIESLRTVVRDDAEIVSFQQSLASLSRFIYDLLSLARLEQTQEDQRTAISMSELMEEVCEEVEVIAQATGIVVESAIAPGSLVLGNKEHLREALLNITSNAVKYMPQKAARKKIICTLSQHDDMVTITVADTGAGIPTSDIAKIFDRFYRGAAARNSVRGTGLGLAIVKSIVTAHNGSITVESTLGEGSMFILTLPALVVP